MFTIKPEHHLLYIPFGFTVPTKNYFTLSNFGKFFGCQQHTVSSDKNKVSKIEEKFEPVVLNQSSITFTRDIMCWGPTASALVFSYCFILFSYCFKNAISTCCYLKLNCFENHYAFILLHVSFNGLK